MNYDEIYLPNPFDNDEDDEPKIYYHEEEPKKVKKTSLQRILEEPYPVDCVDGMLPASGLAFIGGASGDGKSFICLDLAFAIATKPSWFGRQILHNRPVHYYYLEAKTGLRQRIEAWGKHNKVNVADIKNVEFFTQKIDLRFQAEDIAERAPENAVIIIDTLRVAARGVDENSSRDMGNVLASIDEILAKRPGLLVILVHHIPKSTAGTKKASDRTLLAGWSGLAGNADAILLTERDIEKDTRALYNAKVRDSADGVKFDYKLNVLHVNNRPDGKPVYSCAVEYLGKPYSNMDTSEVLPEKRKRGRPRKAA